MSHTYTKIHIHFVFSTKGRLPLISEILRQRLYSYIGGIIKGEGGIPLRINGTNNHIHILSVLPSDLSVSEMMRSVKSNSSRWINDLPNSRNTFGWQTGYGAFCVCNNEVDDIIHYIIGQAEHHRHVSFQEEYLELLKAHGIVYDVKYLWD